MKHYLLFRLLITVLGFLLVTFYLSFLPPETHEATSTFLYALLGFYLTVGVVAVVTFSRWRHHKGLCRQQVLIDFSFQAVLIWSTGGIISIFSPILFVTLAAATGVASTRGAFVLASLATAFLGGATLAYTMGLIPATSTWSSWLFTGEKSVFIAAYLFASVLALYVISALGSKLSYGLRHSENLREEIIENMAEGLLAVDQDGKIVHLNGEARKLLGLHGSAEIYRRRLLREVLARELTETPENADARQQLFDAFEHGGRKRFETHLVDQQGETRPVEVKVSSVMDDKSRLRCRVGLFSDLTLKKEVEDADRRIQKLEELQVMALGIAHEIRNPLASIRGCVQELAKLSVETPIKLSYSEIVLRESDRLDRIIEDFLRFARSGPVDLVPLELTEIIDEAIVLLKQRSDFASRSVEWSPPPADARVYGDRDRLLQVFLNLGINAVQATSPSGRLGFEIAERPFIRRDGNWSEGERTMAGLAVTVWDDGAGISEKDLRKVLTPFFTTKDSGSGLGLSIVERIVSEHMGFIDIQTKVGGGTRVEICLPSFGTEMVNRTQDEVDTVPAPRPEVVLHG